MLKLNRRTFLAGAAGAGSMALAASLPRGAFAQASGPIKIGIIIPLTGATSQFGATMSAAAKAAVTDVNKAGGVNGRMIEVLIEDDQSNPEAAVRAARKLIDVDKVVSIGGSYASAVTSAIAPLCCDSKTVLFTSSGADSITKTPHNGYIFRTFFPRIQRSPNGESSRTPKLAPWSARHTKAVLPITNAARARFQGSNHYVLE